MKTAEPETGRLHALWALDAIGGGEARAAIDSVLADASARVRLQAVRSVGIRGDQAALEAVLRLLKDRDPAVRREAAIAAGKLDDTTAGPALYAALGDADTFAAWSIRQAIRRLRAWDKKLLVEALFDERRMESALRLTDEAWDISVVRALTEVLQADGLTGDPVANPRPIWPVCTESIPTGRARGSEPTRWPASSRRKPRTGRRRG